MWCRETLTVDENFPTSRGALNLVDRRRIAGWAQDTARPNIPVQLEVFVNGNFVAQVVADRFREDLRRAGVGDGSHGFEVALPHFREATSLFVHIRCHIGDVVLGSLVAKYEGQILRMPTFVGDVT